MTNQEIDDKIAGLITSGQAQTTKELQTQAELTEMEVGNSLRRLKVKGAFSFDKLEKRWVKVSAPADEAGLGSSNPPTGGNEEHSSMTTNENSVDDIDSAINKARKSKSTEGSKRTRLSPEERTARDATRAKEQEEKKALRELARQQKKTERDLQRKPAHMSKVDKAASRLPALNTDAMSIFNEATANLDAAQCSALAAHLSHFNRVQSTNRALEQKVEVDAKVRIIGGDPRYIGREGMVSKAQRIRCYVSIADVKKDVYLFTSDVEVIAPPTKKAASA